jgi:hypothetical protein
MLMFSLQNDFCKCKSLGRSMFELARPLCIFLYAAQILLLVVVPSVIQLCRFRWNGGIKLTFAPCSPDLNAKTIQLQIFSDYNEDIRMQQLESVGNIFKFNYTVMKELFPLTLVSEPRQST